MAFTSRSNVEVNQSPSNKPRSFKGHPQPPVNVRLAEAKNFLADEDPNRCLGFREKLAEVEEYVKYIVHEKLDHDESLLRAVKSMADTHRDWDVRTQEGPADSVAYNAPSMMPMSLRLISAENAQVIQKEREAMGIEAQMRNNHAPFTTWRGYDQVQFLKAMQEDARISPEEVDETTNLLWVESRAYTRALQEPGLIPYWMHPTKGLPNRGLQKGEKNAWYCTVDEERRPLSQSLPDYLEHRQQEINRLLRIGDKGTQQEQEKLEELLRPHEPDYLRAQHDEYKYRQGDRDHKVQRHGRILFGGITDEDMRKSEEDLKKAEQRFKRGFRRWCRKFKRGAQLMVIQPEIPRADYPGVFYFQSREAIPPEIYSEVQRAEEILQKVLISGNGFRDLTVEEKKLMINCLGEVVDPQALLDYYDGLRQPEYHGHVPDQDLKHVNRLADIKFSDSMRAFALRYTTLKVLSPGEIAEEMEGVYYLEYRFPDDNTFSIKRKSTSGLESKRAPESKRIIKFKRDREARVGTDISVGVTPAQTAAATDNKGSESIDFTSKAERRGIQRAAIEHTLNILANNQEQRRPKDRFRSLEFPQQQELTPEEAPISLPLEPSRRPVEIGGIQFTKRLMQFRQQSESAYELARTRLIQEQPENILPPANLNGPFTVSSIEDKQDIVRERQLRLAHICSLLQAAEKVAPRPLLQQVLLQIQDGISKRLNRDHPLWDEAGVTAEDTDLLLELTAPSWDEDRKSYDELNLGLTPQQKTELKSFESDIDELRDLIPLWEAIELEESPSEEEEVSEDELFQKAHHDPNQRGREGMQFDEFRQILITKRLDRGDANIHLWTDEEMSRHLGIMRQANRIHFDQSRHEPQISRIPFNGHPENKYVVSREAAVQAPGVRRNELGQLEVQYDANGKMGPPIVQPNTSYHLQKLAFRVGRDISRLLHQLARGGGDSDTYLMEQLEGLNATLNGMGKISKEDRQGGTADTAVADVEEASLQRLAVEVHTVAPDLAREAGIELPRDPNSMAASEAATLLQMQVIEESNNNWESRFPEKEHVWEFAAPRVEDPQRAASDRAVDARQRVKKFFSMRRFPVGCQSVEAQAAIKATGPQMEEKPEIKNPIQPQTLKKGNRLVEVYRGEKQRPYFPFGETPYQQAFLDFRMQHDLKDTPGFQTKPKKRGLLSMILGARKEDRIAPYALPKLPKTWMPRGVSPHERRHSVAKISKSLSGAKDDILEGNPTHRPTGPARKTRSRSLEKKRRASGLAGEQTAPKKTRRVPPR